MQMEKVGYNRSHTLNARSMSQPPNGDANPRPRPQTVSYSYNLRYVKFTIC
jgi:hypothetical protein